MLVMSLLSRFSDIDSRITTQRASTLSQLGGGEQFIAREVRFTVKRGEGGMGGFMNGMGLRKEDALSINDTLLGPHRVTNSVLLHGVDTAA
jgi:hypothetical protein